jgi:hypothetical protein
MRDPQFVQAIAARGTLRGGPSSRARAWLANLHAALGDERRAMEIVDDLCSREPGSNAATEQRVAACGAAYARDILPARIAATA